MFERHQASPSEWYEGRWKEDKKDDYGLQKTRDGVVQYGGWKMDKYDGQGELIHRKDGMNIGR